MALRAQLCSIMEALAQTAVTQIWNLLEEGFRSLQTENQELRRKLDLIESIIARGGGLDHRLDQEHTAETRTGSEPDQTTVCGLQEPIQVKEDRLEDPSEDGKTSLVSIQIYVPGTEVKPEPAETRDQLPAPRRFACSYCGKSFTSQRSLETHVRVHTGERPYSCAQCGKRFTQSGHLKTHQSVHTGERPFACRRCAKRFAGKQNLRIHEQRHHATPTP